jgi:hypothetical protein
MIAVLAFGLLLEDEEAEAGDVQVGQDRLSREPRLEVADEGRAPSLSCLRATSREPRLEVADEGLKPTSVPGDSVGAQAAAL